MLRIALVALRGFWLWGLAGAVPGLLTLLGLAFLGGQPLLARSGPGTAGTLPTLALLLVLVLVSLVVVVASEGSARRSSFLLSVTRRTQPEP